MSIYQEDSGKVLWILESIFGRRIGSGTCIGSLGYFYQGCIIGVVSMVGNSVSILYYSYVAYSFQCINKLILIPVDILM